MAFHWKLPLTALLGLALLTAAAAAAEPEKPLSETDRWVLLQKQLADIKQELSSIREGNTQVFKQIASDMTKVQERLDRLEKDVDRMKTQGTVRRAYSITPQPVPGMGTIQLRNDYSIPVEVVVNGQGYEVFPNEVVTLERQVAGTFTYEVHAGLFGLIRGPESRQLNPNQTFLITVHPR